MFAPSKKIKNLTFILAVIFLSFGLGYVVLAVWQEPLLTPPDGNIDAPLNAGPSGQAKAGGVILNTSGAAVGLIVDKGNVGIGTTAPGEKLDVAGKIHASGDICTDLNGGKCLSTAGGTSGPSDVWTKMSIPTPGVPFQIGQAVWDKGDNIYSSNGVNMYSSYYTPIAGNFEKYSISTNSWSVVGSDPGLYGLIEYVDGYIYAFKSDADGTRSDEFRRYKIADNTWSDLANLPVTLNYNTGGALESDGGDYLYAFTGNRKFWRYSISGDSWTQLSDAISSNEGTMIYANGYIYTILDGEHLFSYKIDDDTWQDLGGELTSGVSSSGLELTYNGGDYLYITFLGFKKSNFSQDISDKVGILASYSISKKTWSYLEDSPGAIGGNTLIGTGSYIYSSSGYNGFWRYTP